MSRQTTVKTMFLKVFEKLIDFYSFL